MPHCLITTKKMFCHESPPNIFIIAQGVSAMAKDIGIR